MKVWVRPFQIEEAKCKHFQVGRHGELEGWKKAGTMGVRRSGVQEEGLEKQSGPTRRGSHRMCWP